MALPLPDPPLADDAVRLRTWSVHDVDALVEAWADAEIQKWTRVPEARDANDALRWILCDNLKVERESGEGKSGSDHTTVRKSDG